MRTHPKPFPQEYLTDTTKHHEALFVGPGQSIFGPTSLAQNFDQMDADYTRDRQARFDLIAGSVFNYLSSGTFGFNARVDASLMHSERNAQSRELLVVTSPLNDGAPLSSADTMTRFAEDPEPSKRDIAKAKPNSWSPAVKLDEGYQLLNKEGLPIPVMQVFSRVPPRAFSARERMKLLNGDHEAFGRIVIEGVQKAETIRAETHGIDTSNIDTLHFFGAGMGQRAIAAAAQIATTQDKYQVGSVNAMNLVIGEKRLLRGLGRDHLTQSTHKEASKIIIPEGFVRIEESFLRKETDQKGTDKAMYMRQVRAMMDLTHMIGMTRSAESIGKAIEVLLENEAIMRVINARNNKMASQTIHYLPVGDSRFNLSDIVGIEGQKVGMMSNEHARLVAAAMVQGVSDYHKSKAAA